MTVNYETESDLYERLVRSMIKGGDSAPISNGKPEHAAVIFKLFFEFASSKVLIFCKDLNPLVFGDDRIRAAAQKAVENGVSIRVITQSSDPQPSNFYTWLSNAAKAGSNVSIKKCKPDTLAAKIPVNFAVMDNKAYRFEPKNDSIQATACMNNTDHATELGKIFQTLDLSLP